MKQFVVLLALAVTFAVVLVGLTCTIPDPGSAGSSSADRAEETHRSRGRRGRERSSTPLDPTTTATSTVEDPPVALRVASGPAQVEPERPDPGYRGVLHGTIMNGDNSAGVADAALRLMHPTGDLIASATTDEAGRYRIERVPELTPLVLGISHPEFADGYCCDLEVTPGRARQRDVRLSPAPTLDVFLTFPSDTTEEAGAVVRLLRNGEEVTSGRTDEYRSVRLLANEPGWHELSVEGTGFATEPRQYVPVGRRRHVSRSLQEGGSLRVRVQEEAGGPASGVRVELDHPGIETIAASTDLQGEVVFEHLYPSPWWNVSALRKDGLVATSTHEVVNRTEREAVVRFPDTGSIEGQLTGAGGEPLEGIDVTLAGESEADDPGVRAPAVTSADGRFTFAAVLPGRWRLHIAGETRRSGHSIRVIAGQAARTRIRLGTYQGQRLWGRVTRRDGQAVEGLRLRLMPADLETTTGATGRFWFVGVDPTTTQTVTSDDPEWRLVEVGDGGAPKVRTSSLAAVETPLIAERMPVRLPIPEDGPSAARDGDAPDPAFPRRVDVTGRTQGRRAIPLGAVRVTCRGVAAYTTPDGEFTLTGVPARDGADTLALHLDPPPGMYLPRVVPHALADDGTCPPVTAELLQRPYLAFYRGAGTVPVARGSEMSCVSGLPDRFLGGSRAPFTVVEARTYDGTWIHLPPVDLDDVSSTLVLLSWPERDVTQINWEHWFPGKEPRYLLAGARDPARGLSSVTLEAPAGKKGETVVVQTHLGLPDTGDTPLPRSLAWQLASRMRIRRPHGKAKGRDDLHLVLQPGTYRAVWRSADGSHGKRKTFSVPADKKVRFD